MTTLLANKRLPKIALATFSAVILLFMAMPVVAVVPMSFSSSLSFELFPSAPSFTQYRQLFSSSDWIVSFLFSIRIAFGVMICATTLGTFAALGLSRLRGSWKPFLQGFLLAPYIVPTIVYAVAAYSVFSRFGLVGNALGITLAHTVLALPVVIVLVSSALSTLDPSLEEASNSLGAGTITTFMRITLPQIRLAVFVSALFSFHLSFDEVVVSLFLSGSNILPLPVKIWSSISYETTPILPAISMVIILVSLCLLTPALLLGAKGDSTGPKL